MKRICFLSIILVFSFVSSSGSNPNEYMQAEHNGKWYLFPTNCNKYLVYHKELDKIYCINGDDIETGIILYPIRYLK